MAENGEFISCSYPGLATHEALKQAVVDDIDRFGMQTSVAITQEAVLSHLFDIIGFHTIKTSLSSCSEIPASRQTSLTVRPASTDFRTAMIRGLVNRALVCRKISKSE
jgi:hypothetical protein